MKFKIIIVINLIFLMSCRDQETRKTYYNDGQLMSEQIIVNGIAEGIAKGFYPSGSIKIESFYKNGLLDGELKVYTEEGNLKRVVMYKQGVLEGTFLEYENSVLVTKSNYSMNMLEGWNYGYYNSGHLFIKQFMKDSLRNGEYFLFYEDGKSLDTKGSYRLGAKNGWFTVYYETGQLKDSAYYKMDTLLCYYNFDRDEQLVEHLEDENFPIAPAGASRK